MVLLGVVYRSLLVPEELEKAISEQEFRDLIGFMLTKEAPKPWSEVPDLPAKNY